MTTTQPLPALGDFTPPRLEVYRPAPATPPKKDKAGRDVRDGVDCSFSSEAIGIWNALGASKGIKHAWINKDGMIWHVWAACQRGIPDEVKRELWQLLDPEQIEKLKETARMAAPNTASQSP